MASPSNQIVAIATISRPLANTGFLKALQFSPLAPDGSNFLEWANDAKIVLGVEELTIYLNKETAEGRSEVLKYQTLLILRRHIDPSLRQQYIQIDHPANLWTRLHDKFYHEQTIFLPKARNDWINLRALGFLDLLSFNAELHHISAQFRLCGEQITETQLIDKTLSTFPLASAIIAHQYQNMNFTKHNKLMSHLLFVEKTSVYIT